ncbi:hypothetical protein N0V84_012507 [Fusarium piperis]|uniref:Aminoglycoside phosphotransferase domain-containing protein n=1 Tax=Fusarium piperis TaxID=1435070 RepID=A0A9W8VZR1_9HYPO|nr:hypothetical protein N0V84_012507 [Fusarium piperis]
MRDAILKDKADKERERFINSFEPEEICQLASSYHGGDPCRIFKDRSRGSFNICFFVEFEATAPTERWVIRIPIPSRYVAAKTSIPVPRVHAFSLTKGSPINTAFIIMDYIQGQTLRDLGFRNTPEWGFYYEDPSAACMRVFEQMADVYIQLRKLEFPRIGALGLPDDTSLTLSTCDADEIHVCRRPVSIEINMQETDGMDPAARFQPRTTFPTASSFVEALLWLADNALDKSRDWCLYLRGGKQLIYGHHQFRRYVLDKWLDRKADNGPFVLMHGDLSLHTNNMLFDDSHRLVGVLDWEWSYVVPAQLLLPPTWLTGSGFHWMMMNHGWFNNSAKHLIAAVKDREMALETPPQLSREWAKTETWCHTAIATALLNPDSVYDVYWRFLFYECEAPRSEDYREFHLREITPRLADLFKSSPKYTALLDRKKKEQQLFFEEEKEYFNRSKAREMLNE